jgi:hypothetical protein
MIDHRADFLKIEGFINKTINPCIDGFFEEGVSSFGNNQKYSWMVGFLELE